MLYLRKLPPWIGLGAGVILWIAPSIVRAYQNTPASYYDWGPYYQPKVLGFSAYAQEPVTATNLPAGVEIPKHSYLLPDNPFYFTKTWTENIQTTFTFDPIAKQERYLNLAEERLAEAYALATQGKVDLALAAADRYQNQVELIGKNLEKLNSEDKNIEGLLSQLQNQAVASELTAKAASSAAAPAESQVFRQLLDGSEDLVDIAADIKDEPAIPDGLSTSFQTLKN